MKPSPFEYHRPETVDELFRTAHSLKGTCRTVGLAEASQLAHSLEDVLDAEPRGLGDGVHRRAGEAVAQGEVDAARLAPLGCDGALLCLRHRPSSSTCVTLGPGGRARQASD